MHSKCMLLFNNRLLQVIWGVNVIYSILAIYLVLCVIYAIATVYSFSIFGEKIDLWGIMAISYMLSKICSAYNGILLN